MSEKLKRHKTLVIIIAVVVIAAVGFGAGMAIRTASANNNANTISADKAKSIALSDVGVSETNATFTKVELDRNDSSPDYDIEFYTSTTEYDFELDAINGTVIEKSSKSIQQNSPVNSGSSASVSPDNQPSASSGNYIGVEKAKQIALKHAALQAGKVTFEQTDLDSDHGVSVYEVDFTSGDKEYDYEINASTGKIVEYDIENIHD